VLSLEAWSRGAARVVCVERDPVAVRAIRGNVSALGAEVEVRRGDARRLDNARYDLVFADPPYADDPTVWANRLAASVRPEGVLVLEHRAGALTPRSLVGLLVDWQRRYGDTEITMLAPKP